MSAEKNKKMGKRVKIVADEHECRRCLTCQLVCSLSHEYVLNPSRSRIKIGETFEQGGDFITPIEFSDECDECGLCVTFCPYGSLSRGNLPLRRELKKRGNTEI